MRENHKWFTDRAASVWKADPGRSMLGIVPFGCMENDVARYLVDWIKGHFPPPELCASYNVAVGRVVPDQTMSSLGFISHLARSIGVSFASVREGADEPSHMLEAIIEALHARKEYPVLIVERFHSFSRVHDDAFLSILSCMRSFEHGGMLTTIALSPIGYDAIRRAISANLLFVNSSYGDNHDRAVMSPLSFSEFRAAGASKGVDDGIMPQLYSLGGGPDVVFQALIDESHRGLSGIISRCAERLEGTLESFLTYAIGPLRHNTALIRRLVDGTSTAADVVVLRGFAQSSFLLSQDREEVGIAGPLLSACVRVLVEAEIHGSGDGVELEEPARAVDQKMKILLVSANSLTYPLDIEAEVRDVVRQVQRTFHRDHVEISHCQAATPEEVVFSLRIYQPSVVHFSAHGDRLGVQLRSEGAGEAYVTGSSIAKAFEKRGVRLAVFNVCLSNNYAPEVARHVDAVVATTEEVDDEAAKFFAVAFYRTLASGFTVGEAFQDASNAVEMNGFDSVFELHGDASLRLITE